MLWTRPMKNRSANKSSGYSKSDSSAPAGLKKYWLVKQEPTEYAWSQFVTEGKTEWTGVRNFQARSNLASMKVGDRVLYYHSNVGKEIVGVAEVTREAAPDPTADEPGWLSVELRPVQAFSRPVSLAQIKSDELLREMSLVKQSRLSVMPVTEAQYKRILKLSALG